MSAMRPDVSAPADAWTAGLAAVAPAPPSARLLVRSPARVVGSPAIVRVVPTASAGFATEPRGMSSSDLTDARLILPSMGSAVSAPAPRATLEEIPFCERPDALPDAASDGSISFDARAAPAFVVSATDPKPRVGREAERSSFVSPSIPRGRDVPACSTARAADTAVSSISAVSVGSGWPRSALDVCEESDTPTAVSAPSAWRASSRRSAPRSTCASPRVFAFSMDEPTDLTPTVEGRPANSACPPASTSL